MITLKKLDSIRQIPAGQKIPFEGNSCFYCRRGELSLKVNGCHYTLTRGTILIHSPFSEIVIAGASADLDGIICGVDNDFIISSTKKVSISEDLMYFANNPTAVISKEHQRAMSALIDLISYHQADDESPLRPQLLLALAEGLFYQMLSYYYAANPISANCPDRNNMILWKFKKDLDEYGRLHKDVKFYASLQNLSTNYFSNIIHKLSGKTPMQWIVHDTITDAKNMILHSHKSFKEIAYELNFPNPSVFARYFRQYTGITPSQYRTTGVDSSLTPENTE